MSRFPARSAAPTHVPPQADAALGSGPAQSDGGGAAGRTLAIHEMDDATLESAAILAAMTHQATGSREHYTRVLEINAERRRRKQARAA